MAKGKGRKNYQKGGNKGSNYKTNNDNKWFNSVSDFGKIASKINTENPLGMPVNVWGDNVPIGAGTGEVPVGFYYAYEPGILTTHFIPGIGASYDATSPANIAGHAEMAVIRSYNSGAINKYDQASLIILHAAVDSAYMWHAALTRLYGTLRKFHALNRYFPEALVSAQGFDYDSVEPMQQRLIFLINKIAYGLNTLYLPKMPIFNRHYWLCSKIFRDGESEKSQLYIPVPAGLHELDEFNLEANPGQSSTKFTLWENLYDGTTHNYLTMPMIEAITSRILNVLLQSASVSIISGDVKKAYGEDVMRLPTISEDYEVNIDYDVTYLHMVHNSTCVPTSLTGQGPLSITEQYDSVTAAMYVKYAPMTYVYESLGRDNVFTKFLYEGNRLIDFKVDDPDSDLIRQSCAWTVTGDSGNWHFGTEIVAYHRIWHFAAGEQNFRALTSIPFGYVTKGLTDDTVRLLTLLGKFYMSPISHFIRTAGSGDQTTLTNHRVAGEIENYTIISDTEMIKMHEATILEGWAVPQVKY